PDVIEILKDEQHKVGAFQLENNSDALGVNDRVALAKATELMRERINEKHMRNGVTLIDPSNTHIETDVKIGSDSVVEPGVYLKGQTVSGEDVNIGARTILKHANIGIIVAINLSSMEYDLVGDRTDIGQKHRLRPGAILQENVHV